MSSKLSPVFSEASGSKPASASLIWLHGSGGCGAGSKESIQCVSDCVEFNFSHIRVIYPTAPLRAYTPLGGGLCNVWYDRLEVNPFCLEDITSVDEICKDLDELIISEMKRGIPNYRIIVGGLSMGGGMALYYGYRHASSVAGIFALSSFLAKDSIVYQNMKTAQRHDYPPLYQAHGDCDGLINLEWGTATNDRLRELGVDTEFHVYPGLDHSLCQEEIYELKNWILTILPDE